MKPFISPPSPFFPASLESAGAPPAPLRAAQSQIAPCLYYLKKKTGRKTKAAISFLISEMAQGGEEEEGWDTNCSPLPHPWCSP